jgi:hypothetical protein
MSDQSTAGEATRPDAESPDATEGFGIVEARAMLGELVHRAGMSGERTVLKLGGRRTAAIVSIKDLERLQSLDNAAA